ncbi:MAG: cysteine desulfurase-like protein [Sandaracinaceae bacterium]
MTDLDVAAARAAFPALSSGWALFDNAGGSVAPQPVIDRIGGYLRRLHVQTGYPYGPSAQATEAVADGHRAAARLLGADPDEVVLGPSSTMNVYVLAHALRATWSEGDEVVVTNLDHECNGGAWRRLADTGIRVREWPFDPGSMELRLEDLEPLLTERTRLVCFTHCSNVVGTIHDVRAITARVHAAGARVCVDGVAYAPHRRVDVRALGVDYYFLSLYKVYGPHLGVLYGRREHLLEARNQNHFFYGEDRIPGKLMPGNVSHELAAGVPGVLAYLEGHGDSLDDAFARFAAHEERVGGRLLDFLASRRDVTILGRRDPDRRLRVPTIAFTVEGRHGRDVTAACAPHRVGLTHGDYYAARAIDALGLRDRGGVIRASMVHYTSEEDVDRLITALEEALA